jgi:hypothetical protein
MNSSRQHPPVNPERIREAMAALPAWMTDNAITWTAQQEARGHEFTGGVAAATHYLQSLRGQS